MTDRTLDNIDYDAHGKPIVYGRAELLQSHDIYHDAREELFRVCGVREFTYPDNPNYEICKYIVEHKRNVLLVYGGNNAGFSEYILEHPETLDELFEIMSESITKNNYTSVIVDRHTEGLHWRIIKSLNKLGEYMKLNHPDIPVYCFNSSYNSPDCQHLVDNVTLVGMAGFMAGIGIENYQVEHEREPLPGYSDKIRPKKYLNLNRIPKPARVYAFAKLAERDLLKHGYTSMTFYSNYSNDFTRRIDKNGKYFLTDEYINVHMEVPGTRHTMALNFNRALQVADIIATEVNRHVIDTKLCDEKWEIDMPDVMEVNPCLVSIDDFELFNLAWFSFVNETNTGIYFQFPEMPNDVFLSEKTAKCIVHRHPFVLFSTHHSLKVLHDMGFRTFSGIIDESYDLLTDPIDRMDACISEVEKLCKYSNSDWQELWPELKAITDHNFDVIMSKNFQLFNFDKPLELV